MVNGHAIRESYVHSRVVQASLGDQIAMREQRARFVNSLVTEEMLLQSMLASDFAQEPALRDRVKAMVAEHLIRTRVGEKLQVDEAQARAYYAANESVIRGETVRVSHIVMGRREECDRLRERIGTDEEFESAAREHSLHRESGARGGVLGRVMNHDGGLGFEQQMFQMEDGQMGVFDGPDGCHLVRAGEREVPPLPPFEAVRERIQALLRREKEVRLLADLVQHLRSSMDVQQFE